MDALLPSEVARLVLGYLQEQNCKEAAKVFMETSPLLQEVHVVAKRGGRYSTRVGGSSLADILDKYCSVNAMIQEKLSKVSDSEQLKQCNDLLEQLRYLLDGSTRSHKFVVNISMPQSSPAGSFGSPSLSGSSRKRHHSSSERSKRAARSLDKALEKSADNSEPRDCDNVEITPLESVSTKPNLNKHLVNNTSETSNGLDDITSSAKENGSSVTTTYPDLHSTTPNLNTNDKNNQANGNFESEPRINKCTAETSTEELMTYSSTEVQTGPCDFLDFESEINDDPIQNLTIITKELMQRSELTERIAENINKSILPVEASREEKPNESIGDANKSLLTDFDNAIKSVVEATNTDPVFEGFLKEIFAVSEPEEDSDGRQNQAHHTNAGEPMDVDGGAFDSEKRNSHGRPFQESDVPLKQRLRSGSLKSHNINLDEEKENNSTLDDQNAEAIMNIVNVIASKRNSLTLENEPIIIDPSLSNDHPVDPVETDPLAGVPPDHGAEDNKVASAEKPVRAKRTRKPRKTTKKKAALVQEEVPTVPTLILCSEEDALARGLDGAYRPIAPKPGGTVAEPQQRKIVLRTVNVPRHLLTPSQIELLQVPQSSPLKLPQLSQQSPLKLPSKLVLGPGSAVKHQPHESITLYGSGSSPVSSSANASGTPSAELRVGSISSMPIISLDEATSSLAAGSGLSPYFKVSGPLLSLSPCENGLVVAPPSAANDSADATDGSDGANIVIHEEKPSIEQPVEQPPSAQRPACESVKLEPRPRTSSSSGDGIIAKRTPRSLLRSRSKNNRLSLSTPRRRRSHVRALDFGTPAKFGGGVAQSARKLAQRQRLNEPRGSGARPVRRSGLFGSPPFSEPELESARAAPPEPEPQPEEPPAPPPAPRRVPIATRSPAPKLQANWNKISGIGLIIGSGDSSASETSADCSSSPEKQPRQQRRSPTAQPPKSWDSDLRKIVGPGPDEPDDSRARPRSARKPRRKIVGGTERQLEQQQQQRQLALDLETPRKTEAAMAVPATPCVVLNTPGDSLIRTCYSKPSTCLSIKDCAVATPDFPLTPCIVLTPKFVSDEDPANRKPSPYYEPEIQHQPKAAATLVEEIVLETRETTTTTTVAKLVMKKDSAETQKSEQPIERAKSVEIVSVIERDSGDESSDSDSSTSSESSSNSSSSSSSSNSSASRSRRSSRANDSLPSSPVQAESVELALDSSSANNSANVSANNSANNSGSSAEVDQPQAKDTEQTPEERLQQSDRQRADFLSPTSGKASAGAGEAVEPVEIVKETPAKMLVDEEAIISDTPSVSEAERAARRDSLTGLTSKMTAIIGSSKTTTAPEQPAAPGLNHKPSAKGVSCSPTKDENHHAVKPKIVDIQKLAPGDGMTLQLSKMMQSDSQRLNTLSVLKDGETGDTSNVNFNLQLEEKRQRLVAKLKQTNNKGPTKKAVEEGKQKRNVAGKKGVDTDKVVSSTSDPIEKTEKLSHIKDSRDSKSEKSSIKANNETELCSNGPLTGISEKMIGSKGALSPSKKILRAHTSKDQDEKVNAVDVRKKDEVSTKKATKECSSASSSSSSSSHSTAAATSVNSGTNAGAVVDHPKGISKARVDQVKRDLFSDDEVNDQRTTRSQTARQITIDTQKKGLDKTSKEAIPGVLECLQLRPANKSDLEIEKESEDEYGFRDNSATEQGEIFYVYDESVPIKKRKRKYSSSELQNEYTIQFPDEVQVLRVTEYEEMFKMAPRIKKKKTPCLKKKYSCKKHRERSSETPSATSSPIVKASKKSHSHEKKKSCKRKHSPPEENKIEKKSKVDPQALFNKIKVDEFLRAVHVPGK